MVASGVCDGKFGGVSEGVVRDDNSVDVVVAAACASSPPLPPIPPSPLFPAECGPRVKFVGQGMECEEAILDAQLNPRSARQVACAGHFASSVSAET